MKKRTAQKIKDEFVFCAHRTLERIKKQPNYNKSPFHRRLIPRKILIASRAEH